MLLIQRLRGVGKGVLNDQSIHAKFWQKQRDMDPSEETRRGTKIFETKYCLFVLSLGNLKFQRSIRERRDAEGKTEGRGWGIDSNKDQRNICTEITFEAMALRLLMGF